MRAFVQDLLRELKVEWKSKETSSQMRKFTNDENNPPSNAKDAILALMEMFPATMEHIIIVNVTHHHLSYNRHHWTIL